MKKYGIAEKWATKVLEDYKKTDEYKKEKAERDEELKNFILYGDSTTWFNDEVLKEICDYEGTIKIEKLSVEQIVERFGDLITEKDIENLNKMRDGK